MIMSYSNSLWLSSLFNLISLLITKTFLAKIFSRWKVFAHTGEIWRAKKSDNLEFLLIGKRLAIGSLAEHVCTNSREKIETWRVSVPIRMPTILRSRTIHQPDRSQTSKKLANSSKPIATRRTLTVLYARSFQITRCSFRDRIRAFRCRSAFLYAYMHLTHAHACDWASGLDGRWKCWLK